MHLNHAYGHIPNQAIISKVAKQKVNIYFINCVLLSLILANEYVTKQMVFSDIYCQVFLKKLPHKILKNSTKLLYTITICTSNL